MSTLYMVRHGQASFGKENYDRLSKRGVEQAVILAEYFLKLGLRFDAVYSGAIERQKRTALEIIGLYRGRGVRMPDLGVMPEFNEYDSKAIIKSQLAELLDEDPALARELESIYTDKKSFQRIFEKTMVRWVTGRFDKPGVENWKSVKARVAKGLSAVMAENGRGSTVLVVASGGTISASVQYAIDTPDVTTMHICWQIINTSITKFMYDSDRITLSSLNAVPHLEEKNEKDIITYR
ncbi:MAG: histidine phosphatase family protein [Spirochaetales bacterium]|nr:MAG: histidine phosphatase family protein [Spirochaetales bacterium]